MFVFFLFSFLSFFWVGREQNQNCWVWVAVGHSGHCPLHKRGIPGDCSLAKRVWRPWMFTHGNRSLAWASPTLLVPFLTLWNTVWAFVGYRTLRTVGRVWFDESQRSVERTLDGVFDCL